MSTAALHPARRTPPPHPRDVVAPSTRTRSPRPLASALEMSSTNSSRGGAVNGTPSPQSEDRMRLQRTNSNGKRSSPVGQGSHSKQAPTPSTGGTSLPVIKKERASSPDPSHPSPTPARHRPRRLDLSNDASREHAAGRPSAPLTSKDSAGLSALHDVGLACLSPGFQTKDPNMQQQMARSMEMQKQQRQIIEARLHKKDGSDTLSKAADNGLPSATFARAPGTSRRKGPPVGLTINAPAPHHFASEPRVIHSAPLNQTFTGLKPPAHPLSRQVLDQSHRHHHPHPPTSTTPQISQFPPPPSATRLPPIQGLLANENLGSSSTRPDTLMRQSSGPLLPPPGTHSPGLPSPGFPPSSAGLHGPLQHAAYPSHRNDRPNSPLASARNREFKSAEDAVQTLSGGREDLLPKIVHYGGHQPPTPPSPLPPGHPSAQQAPPPSADARNGSTRRRTREEYERDYYANEHEDPRDRHRAWEEERPRVRAPFGEGRDSPETVRRKKDEFLGLCSRAWDLMHS